MISTIQSDCNNNGLVGKPLDQRPGIVIPTPENLDRIAANAAAQRNRTAAEVTPQEFGQRHGISRDFSLFLQRLEGLVLEQGREIARLKAQLFNQPAPHLRDVEKR